MEKNCVACGRLFNASKSRVVRCSRACSDAARRVDDVVEMKCQVCGTAYTARAGRLKFGRQTTCSAECSYVLRGKQKETSTVIRCALCGKDTSRSPSQVKGKHGAAFCTRECHYAGRALGISRRVVTKPYVYTNEGILALRRAGARAYAAGKTLPWPESELRVRDRLAALRIPFVHQQVVDAGDRSFSVDFFLPEHRAAVEIDGENHRTRRATVADARRDELLRGLGLRVIRIPDNGSAEDVCRAVLLALAD